MPKSPRTQSVLVSAAFMKQLPKLWSFEDIVDIGEVSVECAADCLEAHL